MLTGHESNGCVNTESDSQHDLKTNPETAYREKSMDDKRQIKNVQSQFTVVLKC